MNIKSGPTPGGSYPPRADTGLSPVHTVEVRA